MDKSRSGTGSAEAVALGLLVALIGSAVYWIADGMPGTPRQFEERVTAAGLDVEWSKVGPRSSDGFAATDCGQVQVAVGELDDELRISVGRSREQLTETTIDDLISCDFE